MATGKTTTKKICDVVVQGKTFREGFDRISFEIGESSFEFNIFKRNDGSIYVISMNHISNINMTFFNRKDDKENLNVDRDFNAVDEYHPKGYQSVTIKTENKED